MINPNIHGWIAKQQEFFNRSTDCLGEEDSEFAPKPGMMTVAQQIAHTAVTVDWFIDGAFTDKGFDMDFQSVYEHVKKVKSLTEARKSFDAAYDRAKRIAGDTPEQQLRTELVPPNDLFGRVPKIAIFSMIDDHTAHHRGALTVYSRLLGKTPSMPYA
jgi:uncharacterized damage-inducible protein DinB